ncbi:MAG: transporter substrate-binding domain-containing protein, partial [Chthoniobacterales bacterium]
MKLAVPVLLLLGGVLSAAEPLRVGMELSYPPFESIGPDGQPQGVSVELARALAQDLGRPLESGKIDLIISSKTATPQRAQAVDFSAPYLTTGLGALVPAGSSAAALPDFDRPGNTVVVRQGTTGEVFARKNIKKARLLTPDKESACVVEVVQGKADAFIYDQL